jgi:tetratricopeptide (TPR) repeat protein
MKDIRKTLTRLDLIIRNEAFCHFNNPVAREKIEAFEKKNGIRLPDSYKLFLEYANGGMIVNEKIEEIIKKDNDLETAKWNAHYFLSLEEMEEKYRDMESWNFGGADLSGISYPFIPFFTTDVNEYLIFVSLNNEKSESPVFDAFHEETVSSWGLVAENFNEFLISYLDTLGQPGVLGDVAKGMAIDLIEFPETKEPGEESQEEIIARTARRLRTVPDDDWAYMERGMAYMRLGETEAALKDFNVSIGLNRRDPFYYFKRGELYHAAGKKRAALIDFDTAVKLKPDDALYLSFRAEALYNMGKYSEALKDVNLVIKKDDTDLLAYMIREDIYRALGETKKAGMDAQKIKELEEDE